MAHRQPHLERRGAEYRWRRRVPARHSSTIVAPVLGLALRAKGSAEAKERARRLDMLSETAFALMESVGVLGHGDDERIIRELARFEIAAADAARARAPMRSRLEADLALQREAAYRETLRDAYLMRDREVARAPVRAACARLGVCVDESTDDWRALADQATRALIEISEIRERRDRGRFDAPLPAVAAALSAIDAGAPRTPSSARPSFRAVAADQGPPAGEATPDAVAVAAHHGFVASTPPAAEGAGARLEAVAADGAEARLEAVPARRASDPDEAAAPSVEAGSLMPAGSLMEEAAPPSGRSAATSTAAASPPDVLAKHGAAGGATFENRDTDRRLSAAECAHTVRCEVRRSDGLSLSEAFDFYISGKLQGRVTFHPNETASPPKGKSWEKNSLSNAIAAKKLWIALIGDQPVDAIPPDRMIFAMQMLQRLPSNWGKSEVERRNKSVLDVITAADARDERITAKLTKKREAGAISRGNFEVLSAQLATPRISVNTRVKHMRELNRVFNAALRAGRTRVNPMEGRLLHQSVIDDLLILEEDRARKPWGPKLRDLYRTPLFTEPLEDPGDPLFWSTIIAPRSGLRSEEIYQLGTDDILCEDGIPYFNITNGPGQCLKSKAARRRVPIHSDILALGFLELVTLRRREGERRLFPDLRRGAGKETFTQIMSKRFGTYRHRHGLYDRTRDFHAFRTGFNVALIDARIDGVVRRALMGHEEIDVGVMHYAPGGQPLHVLREAVESICIGIEGIRHPFRGAATTPAPRLRVVS